MLNTLLNKYGIRKFARYAKYFSLFAGLCLIFLAATQKAIDLNLIDSHLKIISNPIDPKISFLSPKYWGPLIADLFFAISIFHCAAVFNAISKGGNFTHAIIFHLKAIGSSLFFGFMTGAFLQEFLIDLFGGAFHCCRIGIQNQNLLAGILGALLFVLGIMGQKLKTELDEII